MGEDAFVSIGFSNWKKLMKDFPTMLNLIYTCREAVLKKLS